MRISIAMATYRGEAFIRDQLDSIAKQTLLPDELVITDDSPDDRTERVVRNFAVGAPFPVRFHRNAERAGHPENFFRAISLCEGDLIAFADQDDIWLPEKLQRMRAAFDDPGVTLVTHTVSVVDTGLNPAPDRDERHWSLRGTHAPLTTDPWYILFGMSSMVRADLFRLTSLAFRPADHTRNDILLSHDLFAWFMATSLGKVVGLPDRLVLYRQHDANTAGAPPALSIGDKLRWALRAGRTLYLNTAAMARDRATLLAQITDARYVEAARRAQEYYVKLQRAYELRATLYDPDSSRGERSRTLLRLLARASYRPVVRGGLGRRALVKDLYVTLTKAAQAGVIWNSRTN
jgi:glycosyltransferase involved in cell wall biosynthesis